MKFLRSFFILAISLITGFAIAGCGGGGGNNNPATNPPNPNSKYYAYLVDDHSILVYSLNPDTGSLQSTGNKYTTTDGMYFKTIKTHPSQPYLYATCLNSGKYLIKVFGLSPTTGELTFKSEIPTNVNFEQIEFSHDGKYLVAGVSSSADRITSFAIGADGKLTKIEQLGEKPGQTGEIAYCFKFSEDGQTLYYTTDYSCYPDQIKKIVKYTFSNGHFSNMMKLDLDFAPRRFALYNNFIFVKGNDGNLHRFDSDLQESTWVKATDSLAFFTYKNYLYGGGYGTIRGYSIGTAGNLTEFSGAGYPYATSPSESHLWNNMTVDPTGNYLYAADDSNKKLFGYRIGSDGRLTSLDLKVSDPTTYFTIAKF